jgi:hypothetical protein
MSVLSNNAPEVVEQCEEKRKKTLIPFGAAWNPEVACFFKPTKGE